MNIDDLICVGATKNIVVSSTIGRNKKLIPGTVLKEIIEGNEEIIKLLNSFNLNIISSGGETADVGDLVKTIIVDSTVFTRMKRDDVIENNIKSGNVIVGLASFGKSSYEKEYNGGMGSNGLTSARHDVFSNEYRKKLIYSGSKKFTDSVDGVELDAGKLVLSPTRTYAPVLDKIFDEVGRDFIDGIIHCSGGAQTKVLNFIENLHIVKDNLFDIPPLFEMIQKESETQWREMYQGFNMGHRIEIYVDKKFANHIISISKSFNVDAQVIGKVEESYSKKLTIISDKGEFVY